MTRGRPCPFMKREVVQCNESKPKQVFNLRARAHRPEGNRWFRTTGKEIETLKLEGFNLLFFTCKTELQKERHLMVCFPCFLLYLLHHLLLLLLPLPPLSCVQLYVPPRSQTELGMHTFVHLSLSQTPLTAFKRGLGRLDLNSSLMLFE